MDSTLPIVTITGITGYVGSMCCQYFLKDGTYKVRGTVRSVQNAAKLEPLKAAFGDLYDQLELVEADLLDEASMLKAIEGSTYVVHTASPFPAFDKQPKDENVLIKPAVEGTLAVMNGCLKSKVKRCVITSSIVSIMYSADPDKNDFGPDDWSDVNVRHINAYSKSKTLAEKAAWDFLEKLPE